MKRIAFSLLTLLITSTCLAAPPNVVIIFADDLGYGDLAVYGNPTISTPHLDRMAHEGQKWTNFYSASSVCTPSRAALLTGRLPIRSGMTGEPPRVLFPDSLGGLPHSEVTIAEVLKDQGYATAAIGKWHLGHLPKYLPMQQGFDSYYGIPYSNDMDKVQGAPKADALWADPDPKNFNVPLMRNEKIIERPANQHTITGRYTEEAVKFIKANRSKQFFLYLAHSLPHVPLFRGEKFAGKSQRGLYGDVIEEIDWSTGQILDTLREAGLDKNTLVVFTSDNGPWLIFDEQGGSAGPLKEGKGSTWDGGMREPAIFWWPGKLKSGVVRDMGSTMDLLPTIASLTGGKVPTDRVMDGYDISPVLLGTGTSPRNQMFFYRGTEIYATRLGKYKAHYTTRTGYRDKAPTKQATPLLYDLDVDPGEKWNIAAERPGVIEEIRQAVAAHRASVKPVKNQLVDRAPSAMSDRGDNSTESRILQDKK
jgi:arylsulfatase A